MAQTFSLVWLAFTLIIKAQSQVGISGWEIQPYRLPQELVGGEAAAILAKDNNIYYFGGLVVNILDEDLREFEYIDKVAIASLPISRSRKRSRVPTEFKIIADLSVEDGFLEPHFVSGNNALLLDSAPDDIFLTCEDSTGGQIW
eukprot:CAMPEP_0201595550 /NCGR_PEP_ID=MMETSP0190_2-20130828/192517_1 /ASSEMBLY_ACC=CAM_ASM_000263 /TAXON_ID=37353 /ORGANISM="Rosalina sp." /LENGTH=143 /DNA_ID=CAMNT_0048055577 /DNA_START=23 /DNA_END=451 /DNA_ORIENTATION=-